MTTPVPKGFFERAKEKVKNGVENLKLRVEAGNEGVNSKKAIKMIFRSMEGATVELGDFLRYGIEQGAFTKWAKDNPKAFDVSQMDDATKKSIYTLDDILQYCKKHMNADNDKQEKQKVIEESGTELFYHCSSCRVDRLQFVRKLKSENVYERYNPESLEAPSFLRHPFCSEDDDSQPERFAYGDLKKLTAKYYRFANMVSVCHKKFHRLQTKEFERNKEQHRWVKDAKVKQRKIHEESIRVADWFKTFAESNIFSDKHPIWTDRNKNVAASWQRSAMEARARELEDKREKKLVEEVKGKEELLGKLVQDDYISWRECEEALFQFAPKIAGDDSALDDFNSRVEATKVENGSKEIVNEYLEDHSRLDLPISSSSVTATAGTSTSSTVDNTFSPQPKKKSRAISLQPPATVQEETVSATANVARVLAGDTPAPAAPVSQVKLDLDSVIYRTQPNITFTQGQTMRAAVHNNIHFNSATVVCSVEGSPSWNFQNHFYVKCIKKQGNNINPSNIYKGELISSYLANNYTYFVLKAKLLLGAVHPSDQYDFQVILTDGTPILTDSKWSASVTGVQDNEQDPVTYLVRTIIDLETMLEKQTHHHKKEFSNLLHFIKCQSKNKKKQKGCRTVTTEGGQPEDTEEKEEEEEEEDTDEFDLERILKLLKDYDETATESENNQNAKRTSSRTNTNSTETDSSIHVLRTMDHVISKGGIAR